MFKTGKFVNQNDKWKYTFCSLSCFQEYTAKATLLTTTIAVDETFPDIQEMTGITLQNPIGLEIQPKTKKTKFETVE